MPEIKLNETERALVDTISQLIEFMDRLNTIITTTNPPFKDLIDIYRQNLTRVRASYLDQLQNNARVRL